MPRASNTSASREEALRSPAQTVDELRASVVAALREAVGTGTRVAVVDFPNHDNLGDTAIWHGEMAALRELGCEVAYVASASSYSRALMRRRLGSHGVILLHGGGNFGDIWLTYHSFRERVISENPDYPIVQLPQTAYFGDRAARDKTAEVCRAHPRLTLMARDQTTLDVMGDMVANESTAALVPDAAFALGNIPAPPPTERLRIIARSDAEARGAGLSDAAGRIPCSDWAAAQASQRVRKFASQVVGKVIVECGPPAWPAERPLERLFSGLATERMRDSIDQVASGGTIITDRLHAHIVALLLGRSSVLLNNTYGKNRAFFDQWTSGTDGVVWAEDVPSALSSGLELAARRDT